MDEDATNLAATNRRLAELQDEYGDVPVEERRVVLPAEEFSGMVAEGGDFVGGAYAWVVRTPADASGVTESFLGDPGDDDRVLFHLPRGSDEWGLPGGGLEGDESFEEAAVREVREETGVECEVTDCWMLQRLEWISDDEADDRATYSAHAFFDARYTGGHISIQPGESNGAAWFADLPPDERLMEPNRRRAESWNL
jgi:8-oxo-dGTP pyrophosphatase MutT (NUDIX family)